MSEHTVDVLALDPGLPDVQGLAMQALREGARDYLVKGQIETFGLLRAVRHAIERKIIETELNWVSPRTNGCRRRTIDG